jgi:hypothetical protein
MTLNTPYSESIQRVVLVDEDVELPIDIEYDYHARADHHYFGRVKIVVTDLTYFITGTTETPKEEMRDAIHELVRECHAGYRVYFECELVESSKSLTV